jgi:hypothetical protein
MSGGISLRDVGNGILKGRKNSSVQAKLFLLTEIESIKSLQLEKKLLFV